MNKSKTEKRNFLLTFSLLSYVAEMPVFRIKLRTRGKKIYQHIIKERLNNHFSKFSLIYSSLDKLLVIIIMIMINIILLLQKTEMLNRACMIKSFNKTY